MMTLRKKFLLLPSFMALLCAVSTTLTLASQEKPKKAKSEQNAAAPETKAKVDVNTASEEELDQLPGIGPASAKKIIAGRPYSSVAELSKVGIPAKTVEKITPLVTAGGPPPANEDKGATPRNASNPPAAHSAPETSSAPAPPSKGMVWVNLSSGVYHYEGNRWYGKTKNGKYMWEADAVKAGYHPAKDEKP